MNTIDKNVNTKDGPAGRFRERPLDRRRRFGKHMHRGAHAALGRTRKRKPAYGRAMALTAVGHTHEARKRRLVVDSGAMFRPHVFRLAVAAAAIAAAGCRSTAKWREAADEAAARHIAAAQAAAGAVPEEIAVESAAETLRRRLLLGQNLPVFDPASLGIRDLPANRYWRAGDRLLPGRNGADAAFVPRGTNALEIGLQGSVRIAAANSPDFRAAKEELFASALALDLESREFHSSLLGALSGATETERGTDGARVSTHDEGAKAGASKTFENGVSTDAALAFNLTGMLDGDRKTAWGAVADTSVSIPLLRGSGRLVRRESLTQAERDLVYAVRAFEQRKRAFVVEIGRSYLSLLLALRTRQNEDANYRRVVLSTRRSRRMADASRMSKAAFDQSYQSELAARARWTAACQNYESALDAFKTRLGLPPDSAVKPRESDMEELETLVSGFLAAEASDGAAGEDGDPQEAADRAIAIAFERRSDIATARDRVEDAQRHLAVAEDGLRAEVTIGGAASVGEAATASTSRVGRSHAPFRMRDASASGTVKIDLPLERTKERNSYRNALVALESAVRDYQKAEDELKTEVREDLRALAQTREQLRIQSRAVELAGRRVRNQDMLLEAGRADMKDLLDAQAALLSAQNSLYRAITDYRQQELALQRDMGTLDATADGVWTESDLAELGVSAKTEKGT